MKSNEDLLEMSDYYIAQAIRLQNPEEIAAYAQLSLAVSQLVIARNSERLATVQESETIETA